MQSVEVIVKLEVGLALGVGVAVGLLVGIGVNATVNVGLLYRGLTRPAQKLGSTS